MKQILVLQTYLGLEQKPPSVDLFIVGERDVEKAKAACLTFLFKNVLSDTWFPVVDGAAWSCYRVSKYGKYEVQDFEVEGLLLSFAYETSK